MKTKISHFILPFIYIITLLLQAHTTECTPRKSETTTMIHTFGPGQESRFPFFPTHAMLSQIKIHSGRLVKKCARAWVEPSNKKFT
jgi:hypothetical protein